MAVSKIKTFQQACKALKLDPVKVLPKVSGMPKRHQLAIEAHAKLVIICEALNEGWKPNWNDHSQYKYYPWFKIIASEKKPSGSALSFLVVAFGYSDSDVGSRLCFKSRDLAEYAATTFKKLYTQYFLLD